MPSDCPLASCFTACSLCKVLISKWKQFRNRVVCSHTVDISDGRFDKTILHARPWWHRYSRFVFVVEVIWKLHIGVHHICISRKSGYQLVLLEGFLYLQFWSIDSLTFSFTVPTKYSLILTNVTTNLSHIQEFLWLWPYDSMYREGREIGTSTVPSPATPQAWLSPSWSWTGSKPLRSGLQILCFCYNIWSMEERTNMWLNRKLVMT